MNTWQVRIENWHPARLNQLMVNRWKKHDLRRLDDDMVSAMCRFFQVPKATGKRRVSLEITLGPRMRADPDCWWKSLLDALKNCGMIMDDNSKWVELGGVVVTHGPRRETLITLEDLSEEHP